MNMQRRVTARRAGLTLIELVVVLTILTALGGLLVPIIGGMIDRTHFAKCAVTIPDLSRQISRSYASNLRYPDTWDSLMDVAAPGTLFPKLPGGGDAGGELVAGTIDGAQAAAFIAIGITEVVDLDATLDGDATWDVSIALNVRPLDPGGTNSVATLVRTGPSARGLNLKRHLG
ncbi:MAG: type II secretion system protein, partial [Bacteroidota bacterium]